LRNILKIAIAVDRHDKFDGMFVDGRDAGEKVGRTSKKENDRRLIYLKIEPVRISTKV